MPLRCRACFSHSFYFCIPREALPSFGGYRPIAEGVLGPAVRICIMMFRPTLADTVVLISSLSPRICGRFQMNRENDSVLKTGVGFSARLIFLIAKLVLWRIGFAVEKVTLFIFFLGTYTYIHVRIDIISSLDSATIPIVYCLGMTLNIQAQLEIPTTETCLLNPPT